ncbi:protein CutA homolog [Strongylocentrotus purpuratus]|uniref:Uncharacterized protein n=1 Tax=Strongylocentrotus purpuratus TaxID=7668 RepID=A0A7M7T251_STRPU|nr:protein CutA homolog [Strongylocentrotus purpuratus]
MRCSAVIIPILIGLTSFLSMSLIFRGVFQRILPTKLNLGLVLSRTMTSNESSTEAASKLTAAFVTVPGPDATVAEKLASDIVEQKLAACVNVIPGLTSVYEWEGKIEKDQELLLMIKTKRSKIDELSEFVRKNHPYDVAEVISLPIENGNLPYLQWVAKTVPE